MFGFIGQTIGKMFGTDKAVASLVEHTSSALDKLVYTSEEKAEDLAKDRSEARHMVIKWMAATSGQNLARRLLALMVTMVWLLIYLTMTVFSCISPWVTDPKPFLATAELLGTRAEQMNGAMMLILAFYFAAPHMGDIVNGAMRKFSK